MTKFLYTYDVVRVDSGVNRPIATGFGDKALATRLSIAALNNVKGRDFVVKQRRTRNPLYVEA
jgi:hypothetical protein